MHRFRLAALAPIALTLMALGGPASAQTVPSEGTYVIDGGSYSITLERDGAAIVVVEPNKRSVYAPAADGSFQFFNPNTDTLYGIRVLDDHRIAAFKPDRPEAGDTILSLVGRAPQPAAAPIATVDIPASTIAPTDTLGAIAHGYQARAQSDPDNAQAWTACAAAALKRSTANPAESDAYAIRMAKVLKLIIVDPARSPCEDAITPEHWAAASGAAPAATPVAATPTPAEVERDRLRAEAARADAAERAHVGDLNRQAADRAKADTDKILAGQQAAARARQDYQAAQARYLADKARSDAEAVAARQAQADYDRRMLEYRAKYGK